MTQEEFDILWKEHLELVNTIYIVWISERPIEDTILFETSDKFLALSRASLEEMLSENVKVQSLNDETFFVVKN